MSHSIGNELRKSIQRTAAIGLRRSIAADAAQVRCDPLEQVRVGATDSSAAILMKCARQRGDRTGTGRTVRIQFRLLQGLRHPRVRMSLRCDQDGSRDIPETNRKPARTGGPMARKASDSGAEMRDVAARP